MKKRITFIKMLLVAALLGVGSSAWADATVVYGRAMTADVENGYTAWSSADVASSGSDLNVWYGNFIFNETYGLYASGTGARSSVMTFSHTNNSLQTFDIVFNNLGNTGNAANYSYIRIGSDIEIQSNQQNQTGTVIINGNSSSISNCNVKDYNRGGDSWTIHIEINTAKNTVTALTILGTLKHYKNNEADSHTRQASYTLASETALSSSATYNTVTIGFTRSGGTPSTALTSIKIAEEAQAVTNADYTINYKFGEDIIKTEEGTSTVGAVVNAVLPFTKDGQKYYAADGATTSIELTDGENILNVNLRKATVEPYSVNLINSANSEILVENAYSGNIIEDETSKVYYHKAINVGGVWYVRSQNGSEPYYGINNVVAGTSTVSYTENSGVSYFFEVEDLPVVQKGSYDGWRNDGLAGRSSGGQAPRHYAKNYAYTDVLEGGVYELVMNARNQSGSVADNIILAYMDENDNIVVLDDQFEDWAKATTAEKTVTVSIPDGARFVLKCGDSNSNLNMDFLMFTRIGDYTISQTVTSAGWATLFTKYALDFSSLSSELTAYTATLKGSTVTLNAVDEVPANTGVVLKGAAKEYRIPVIVSSDTEKGDLKGSATDALTYDADAAYDYYLLKINDNSEAQFSKLTGGTIAAGKAYLQVAKSNEARVLSVVFGNGTTGIANVDVNDNDNLFFDLQGRKVTNPTKGLYIMRSAEGRLQGKNGKKVVVK